VGALTTLSCFSSDSAKVLLRLEIFESLHLDNLVLFQRRTVAVGGVSTINRRPSCAEEM